MQKKKNYIYAEKKIELDGDAGNMRPRIIIWKFAIIINNAQSAQNASRKALATSDNAATWRQQRHHHHNKQDENRSATPIATRPLPIAILLNHYEISASVEARA